jgi:membrane associated rhomboid family serine protease
MKDASHTIGEELHGVLLFVGAIWAVFGLSLVFPSIDGFGLAPRTPSGLVGIVAMPFLHANLQHLLSNTFPLLVLLVLLAGSRARSWEIVAEIIVLGGLLLWLFGRSHVGDERMVHVGASGLIFGLIAFLIVSGVLEGRLFPLLISLVVGALYGGTLLTGVMPWSVGAHVSWDGHLCGAIAGGLVAVGLARNGRETPRDASRDAISSC